MSTPTGPGIATPGGSAVALDPRTPVSSAQLAANRQQGQKAQQVYNQVTSRPPAVAGAQTGDGGGGGGGGGGTSAAQNALAQAFQSNPDLRNIGEGMSAEDRLAEFQRLEQQRANEINELYSGSNNFLNQQEDLLRGSYGDLVRGATGQFDAQIPILNQARADAERSLAAQQAQEQSGFERRLGGVRQEEASALTDARRLFNELQTGNRQRFGGTNAGQFVAGLQQRELQRQLGSVQNTAGRNVAELQAEQAQVQRSFADRSQQIQENYTANLRSIEAQRQAAVAQAEDLFRQRLVEINNARGALEQQKAAARLDALRELRNDIRGIEQQRISFQQGLQQQFNQANLQLRNAVMSYQANAGQPVDLSQITPAQVQGLPFAQFTTPTGGAAAPGYGANIPFGTLRRDIETDQPLLPLGTLSPDDEQLIGVGAL